MLRVWADNRRAGLLGRFKVRGSVFAYDGAASGADAISVTMPARLGSWNTDFGLAPIFEMNLPEGALRALLARRFAKAVGTFDDFDLLTVVGRTQIGRLRYSDKDGGLAEDVPFQSVDEILRARRGGGLFDHLLDRFAVHSGLSGVQPKVLIRGVANDEPKASSSIRTATHIVKLWDDDYPELAANEYFCLQVARRIGLRVPRFQIADDGGALIIDRFDLRSDGTYLGFEDFCVLNGLPAAEKYRGGYETRLFKRVRDFIAGPQQAEALVELFKLFALNCAIRNGDAHLKNFGVVYADVQADASLAPAYDLVTTQAYLATDPMALTLNGSTNWPDGKKLTSLGQTRADLRLPQIVEIFEQIADAVAETIPDLVLYFNERANFPEIGKNMLEAWKSGIRSQTPG